MPWMAQASQWNPFPMRQLFFPISLCLLLPSVTARADTCPAASNPAAIQVSAGSAETCPGLVNHRPLFLPLLGLVQGANVSRAPRGQCILVSSWTGEVENETGDWKS
ncbi:hypothetical protein B0T10DRAFT_476612 [Thelonectria olida]|uniref:Uncharacterized protein n=1 Tax=Thelonectria olida TaxID=1576542 RepID=A0A9P8WE44_9HYPO|nr:hypothetical protein B0T10DRAFT_476612 [Thelonectria olida]